MRKLERYEMEDMALERIKSIVETDEYNRGVLDTYIRILGTSKGLREYLHDEFGEDVIGFLQEMAFIEENENGEVFLLDL